MRDVDIAIIGGGPIGLTAGIALDSLGYRVSVFERRKADETIDDRRTLALAEGSRLILARLGIWSHLKAVTPITRIHVSESGRPDGVMLTASECDVPALGHVITYNALLDALASRAGKDAAAWLHFGTHAQVTSLDTEAAELSLQCGSTVRMRAALVLHAEGGAGNHLDASHLITSDTERTKDYGQCAIVAEVWTASPVSHEAFEHFTENGPVALLPSDDHYALVWTVPSGQKETLLGLDDAAFHQRLNANLPAAAGPVVRSARRGAFPLRMRMARSVVDTRTLLVGNAAQQLHPVAAQGFNVGLRDVWALRELLWNRPKDPGASDLLAIYARNRRLDRDSSLWITDGMVAAFGSTHPLLRIGRGLALRTLGTVGILRSAFAKRMMFGAQ